MRKAQCCQSELYSPLTSDGLTLAFERARTPPTLIVRLQSLNFAGCVDFVSPVLCPSLSRAPKPMSEQKMQASCSTRISVHPRQLRRFFLSIGCFVEGSVTLFGAGVADSDSQNARSTITQQSLRASSEIGVLFLEMSGAPCVCLFSNVRAPHRAPLHWSLGGIEEGSSWLLDVHKDFRQGPKTF